MPATISSFWKNASAAKRAVTVIVAAAIAALAIGGITFGAMSAGGDDNASALAPTPTASGPTPTPNPPTPTVEDVLRYFAAILPTATATPEYRGGGTSTGGGGTGGGGGTYRPSGGTGPGPILSTDIRLQIPKLGINTAVNSRSVGTNGQMGDPSGAWMVVWYDFSGWGGLGGYPGQPGANVVMAGHVDYIRVGPAVFYGLKDLAPGDQIIVSGANGPVTYAVQWSAWSGPHEDFTGYVAQQGQDVITLVTCVGSFSGGHYSNRLIIRGARI
ncbi:MAG TPA: class F sortase [Dehalococcoidia bacterium]|jgi:LPXTG-site transpeptidase (sortase) family protein|nr:class F sortase [Dehalococcoidia bacterium]